ncbi:MAG: ATP-binding protein [Xanthomonadaceae bacterium]|nr:ATP-binding protein [Xanthomonadaceae bacterium]
MNIPLKRTVGYPVNENFFLFGPRGTGKSSWLAAQFPQSQTLDLLDSDLQIKLMAKPSLLESLIEKGSGTPHQPIIIDEVQKIPSLLDEVHRLIEKKKKYFILTGSSARKLKREGTNLLGGRAITCSMNPFSSLELGNQFDFSRALKSGLLPKAYLGKQHESYLASYVTTYLKEEVQQEGLVRSLEGFTRFLQTASFSQGSLLNKVKVAEESSIGRRAAEGYFEILKDLLLSIELPVFTKRANRKMVKHSKFYFFDTGVFRQLRPRGPLDSDAEINGAAFETLILQDLKAMNDSARHGTKQSEAWNADIYFWQPSQKKEVDFVLYGPKIFTAIEVKATSRLRKEDFSGLNQFHEDYPEAKRILIYTGNKSENHEGISIITAKDWFSLPLHKRL